MIIWISGQEKTIEIKWSLCEYEIEISEQKELSLVQVQVRNKNESGQGKIYFDNFVLEEGVFLDNEEDFPDHKDITYVTKLDHTAELPASIQHHLLAEPYLHADKGTVKISDNDTTSTWLGDKLVAGDGITLTENDEGGNETITIAASGGGGGIGNQNIILWPEYSNVQYSELVGAGDVNIACEATSLDISDYCYNCVGQDAVTPQGINILVRHTLPATWTAWNASALQLTFRTNKGGWAEKNWIDLKIGKVGTGVYGIQSLLLSSDVNDTWKTITISKTTMDTLGCIAGDTIEVLIIPMSISTRYVGIGRLNVNYVCGLQTIVLWPEYPNAQYAEYPGIANMTISCVYAALDTNNYCYNCTGQDIATEQAIYILTRWTLPETWTAWQVNALQLTFRTKKAGWAEKNWLNLLVGKVGSGVYDAQLLLQSSDVDDTWKSITLTKTMMDLLLCVAGDTIEIAIIPFSISSRYVDIGKFQIQYS